MSLRLKLNTTRTVLPEQTKQTAHIKSDGRKTMATVSSYGIRHHINTNIVYWVKWQHKCWT